MGKLVHRRLLYHGLIIVAVLFCLAPARNAAAAFNLVSEATITKTAPSQPVSVTLTVTGKGGSPVLFDAATNQLMVRGNAQFDVRLSYSPLPPGFDPSSSIQNKGIFATAQPGPWSGGSIGTSSAIYTQNGTARVIYGDVKYTLYSKPGAPWGTIELIPYFTVVDADIVVQTKNEDGTIQAAPNVTTPGALDTLLPAGTETANLTFNMFVVTTDKTHRGNWASAATYVPAAGVPARVLYQARGTGSLMYATPWATTDASGHALTTIGAGRETVAVKGWHYPSRLYLEVTRPAFVGDVNSGGYLSKILVLEGMQKFRGTINLKITDPDDHPLSGAVATSWGGMNYLGGGSASSAAGADGTVSLQIPYGSSGAETKNIEVALNPIVTVKSIQTQVVDFPARYVDTLPAFLSPQIDLSPSASSYKNDKAGSRQLIVRIKDSRGGVVDEIINHELKHPEAWTPVELLRGKNRLYYPFKPPLNSDFYTIEAVFQNFEDEVEEDEQVVGSAHFPVLKTNEPAYDHPFNFQFVAVSSTAPAVPPGTSLLSSRLSTGQMGKYMKWVQKVMPAPVTYSTGPDQVASSWYMDSGRIKYYFYKLNEYRPRDVDLVIGVVAPGDLNSFLGGTAAGLSMPGYPYVVLIDPSKLPEMGVLHEFLHTRGLPDNYKSGVMLAAADGYDAEKRLPMINLKTLAGSYPQVQAVMFDSANEPWLTYEEYGKLLDYATVPIARSTVAEDGTEVRGARRAAAPPQKVLLISARYQWAGAPFVSPQTLVADEPLFSDWETPYVPQPSAKENYTMPGVRLNNASGTIKQDAWVLPLNTFGQPVGVWFDPADVGSFTFKVPYRDDYSSLIYGGFNWRKELVAYNKTLIFSANAPTAVWMGPASGTELKGRATITYAASDKDAGATLYGWVKVSTDGGQTWRAAAPYAPIQAGTNTFTLDCNQFPTTTNCKIKVLVSDGLRSTILEPAQVYKLTGYAAEPKILAEPLGYAITVKAPARFTIPLRITNQGIQPLSVDIDPASLPAWVDKKLSRLTGQVVAGDASFFPLFGTLSVAGKYTATLKIRTNDPQTPILSFPVTITVGSAAPAPQVAFVQSEPFVAGSLPIRKPAKMTFSAWELAGHSGLEARIRIEQTMPSAAVLLDNAPMSAGPTPGQYVYTWTPPAHGGGKGYAVEVTMVDPATGLKDANGSISAGWDLAFELAGAANRAPVFTLPVTSSTTVLSGLVGKEIVLSYAVSDPDGDPLSFNLDKSPAFAAANNTQVKWDTAARQIRFTPIFTGTYSLTLSAMDPAGALSSRLWTIHVTANAATGHALPSNADYTILAGTTYPLSASIRAGGGDKGCRFDWRLQGAAVWNKSALVAWRASAGDPGYLYANLAWTVSSLTAGATYEVRYVNVNAQGKDDPSPTVLHFLKPANGGKVTKIEAPATVAAGQPFSFRVFVLNTSTFTWTRAGGYKLTSGAVADPFTKTASLELGPSAMVPPGGTAVYQAWATAPATAGSYMTKWQPYTATLKAYGTAAQASIKVVSPPPVDLGALRDYLLGKWTPSSAWMSTADLDKDGKVNVADLLRLGALLRSLQN